MTPPPQDPFDPKTWGQQTPPNNPNNPYQQNPYQQQNYYQQNPYQQQNYYQQNPAGMQVDVPNATLVLVMGICAIVIGCLGPILGTIGLVMAKTGRKSYQANPAMYRESSYKQLNAGYICSIIGLCIGCCVWIFYIVWFIVVASIFGEMAHAIPHQY
jgi:hypothetical protein